MQLRRKLPFMGVEVLCSLKCATFLKKTSESNRTERVRLRRGQTSGPKGSGKAQKWTAVLQYIEGVERSRYAESMSDGRERRSGGGHKGEPMSALRGNYI